MDLRADARIPFPRSMVFAAYRDDMDKLLPYLPNVRAIEVKSRKEHGAVVEIVNHWRGGGEIPAAVRVVLSESMLAWVDYAKWDADALACDWRTETPAFAQSMQSSGRNAFHDDGSGKTLLEVRGSIVIDAKKLPGVPGFFAGSVGRLAEAFLVEKIQANLLETARAMSKYLATVSPTSPVPA
jgi:hypothetical protein